MQHAVTVCADNFQLYSGNDPTFGDGAQRQTVMDFGEGVTDRSVGLLEVEAADLTSESAMLFEDQFLLFSRQACRRSIVRCIRNSRRPSNSECSVASMSISSALGSSDAAEYSGSAIPWPYSRSKAGTLGECEYGQKHVRR